MGRQAARVYSDPQHLQRFAALVETLSGGSHVRLALADGSACEGVVSARPTAQEFFDGDGNEGINGMVNLERGGVSDWRRTVWFDEIVGVEHLAPDGPKLA